MNPIIRWAGSKRAVLHHLREYWPATATRYVEPFAGSACLFFDLLPTQALLGDLNTELIATYRAIRRDHRLVEECLGRLPTGSQGYYRVRAQDPAILSEAESAARFLYLNRHCFNGLYRTNKSGKFNVPYGPPKRSGALVEYRLAEAALALRNVSLIAADFETTLSQTEIGDFVYLDPPYAVSRRRVFAEYLPGSFAAFDLERLSSSLALLNERGIKFLVSYADSKEARDLLRDWNPKRIWTRRNIAGFAAHRRGAYELIASNS